MNILILTGNGREHALAQAYSKSKKVKKIIMIPGNGLTDYNPSTSSGLDRKIKNYPDVAVGDFKSVLKICKQEKIDFVDVSQDDIIGAGYVDKFTEENIATFGPTKKAAQIEWDKAWARDFMKKYQLPIPQYETFSDANKAITYVNKLYKKDSIASLQNDKNLVLFIKAAGLAGGKGVIRSENKQQAIDAINGMKEFGKSGDTFVIEQELKGSEFSLFALCDGKEYTIIGSAQDHKTVYNKNKGLNTGGMGCVSNPQIITPIVIKEVEEKILQPFMIGMQKENRPYSGVLYLGGMLTTSGVKVIEFNARWGDPETEVLVPAIKNDYVDIVNAVIHKKLSKLKIVSDNKKRLSVCGVSFGYPGDYKKTIGKEIFGLEEAMKISGVTIYGAGVKRKGKKFFANGGRLFHVMAEGKDIKEARQLAYAAMSMIYIEGNNLHFRTDIGWGELEKNL
ncbi:MAG: phosphoribosylamine--glycine ligase [Candidatus Levybacteria bacterium]|nr:phosphoribosylamine--glycine ligase [Candidatus Levybacteria bacterium]